MAREKIKNKQFKTSQVGSQLPTCGNQVGSQLPTCDFRLVVSYQLGAQVGSQLPTHIKEKYIIELKSYSELKQKFSTFGRKTLCFTSEYRESNWNISIFGLSYSQLSSRRELNLVARWVFVPHIPSSTLKWLATKRSRVVSLLFPNFLVNFVALPIPKPLPHARGRV